MLRLGALLGMLLATVLLASGAGAAGSLSAADTFDGEWQPDTTSAAGVASEVFTITDVQEVTARGVTGTNSANFDVYCKSTNPGVQPATYFTVATTTFGTFGGCVSGKTGGHIYTWNSNQVWYAHAGTLKGEPVLNGTLEILHGASYKFRAHHPLVRFATHVKYTSVGKKGGKAAELITATGAGGLTVLDKPANCTHSPVLDGVGALTIEVVKVGGPSLVELDKVGLKIEATGGSYRSCDTQASLEAIPVVVTKSDPAEKDACPVGSQGSLYLTDRSAQYGSDGFAVEVGKCHLALSLSQAKAKKGSRVTVAVTFDENGY